MRVKTDFNTVVAAVSSLLGEDLLSYLRTRQEDIQLRSKYLYRFDDGQVAYDCSLGERFTGPMIPLVIKKIITMWDSLPASERGFKSEFAKKAWADLLAYEEIKAADEANLSDLLERPYEDLVTEEIIDSLPGPKIEVVEPEDDPDKVKVEGVSMDTESTEPTQMEVEGGSVDPVSTKDEVTEDVEMDDSHAQSAPFTKPRTSADPPTTEVKEESGSVNPEFFVGLGEDQNVFDNLPKISEEEVQEAMRKQGVWGKQSTYVDPRDIDMARTFSSAPDASKASEINDEFVATSKKGEEQLDFKTFMEKKNQTLERSSPTFALANQKHGPNTGFYHDGGRTDLIYWFKLQHMIFRDTRTSMTHPTQKYGCSEMQLWNQIKRLPPVYEGRVSKGKIIFDAGDVRSTVDDVLLERSSNAAEKAANLRRELLEKLESVRGTRGTLQNSLLHHFLSCGIDKEEIGELTLDHPEIEKTIHHRERDQTTFGHVYTSKIGLGYLTVNLGNFVRGRKNTLPKVYAGVVDELDDSGVGPMVKSLARSKSHLILLNEASELLDSEIAYLVQEGWLVHQNNAKDLAIMIRCNYVGAYINQIAGSTMERPANKYLPLSYMLCEVCFGKCPSQEEIEEQKGSRNLKDYDHTNMSEDLTRAGMNVMRVCVFHMKSHIASRQPGLCHEAYGIMLADCFAFQADIMSGDANMSAYRYGGSRQQSSSIKHSCWQDMVRYFVKGHNEAMGQDPNCRVVPRFVSSNSLSSLRWWEDTFGREKDRCRAVNWDTVPDLDCLVSCILEWAHTFTDDKWSVARPGLEYRIQISEWLLHSSKDDYLFSPTDKDAHAPLLIHITPQHFSASDLRATQRTQTKVDRNARRKERQKINKAQASSSTPAPTSGSAAPVTPPKAAPTSAKGKTRNVYYGKGKGQK